jgi:spermidine synthase
MVNILHSHTMCALGIKHKIYDGEFLMAIVELLNEHGIAVTFGECLIKAINHFLASVSYNLTG